MDVTLQGILHRSFSGYARQRRLPLHLHKAAHALMTCRTSVLGGHVQRCPEGHVERVWYNSCKHRVCPQCAALPTERWLASQQARLLGCDHYHVIFTMPHELLALWRRNPRHLAQCLFRAAADTLFELLGDAKYLGAMPGLIGALHSWGRSLSLHPHVHFLVTGGGLSADGRWCGVSNGFLLPGRVVRDLFRGKFLAAIRRSLARGELQSPPGESGRHVLNLLNKLGRVKWNVCVRERYAHGQGVMRYLSRYVKGGPLHNDQLLRFDGETVTFGYTDHRDGRRKPMTLSTNQFLHRWFWHVPETGMHTVRYFGLYAHGKAVLRAQCRSQLGQAPETKPAPLDWQSWLENRGRATSTHCSVCGRRLISGASLPRGPPSAAATHTDV